MAPTSKDPREYAKYKTEYDAYSEWSVELEHYQIKFNQTSTLIILVFI